MNLCPFLNRNHFFKEIIEVQKKIINIIVKYFSLGTESKKIKINLYNYNIYNNIIIELI